MIRRLRWKIMALTMAALMGVTLLANGILYIAGSRVTERFSQNLLRELCEGIAGAGGEVRPLLPRELPEQFRDTDTVLCAVVLDPEGRVVSRVNLLGEAQTLSGEALEGLLASAGTAEGYGEWEGFQYYRAVRPEGAYLVAAGGAARLYHTLWRRLSRALWLLMLPAMAAVLLVCLVLSHFIVRPVQESLRKQRQFLSDAGHELKTPLSAITVNAAVLAQETGPSLYLDCIREEALRMGNLLRRMMDVARMDAPDGEPPRRQRVDLSALACQAALPFESLAFERSIRYVLDIQEGQTCQGDPEQLRQVAAILLDNAFKYVDQGGTVRVRLCPSGRHAMLEVANTGPGISPEDLPYVFQRFYRCDKARPDDGSYGLGLSIAQTIVEAHGGRITAESQPGGWTRFRVLL